MTTSQLENKLLNEKNRWEGIAAHMIEQASSDSQSNYMFRKAQEKLKAIDQTLRRVSTGTFGRCDECGALIEPERLEFLIDSDCHVCARCAATSMHQTNSRQRSPRAFAQPTGAIFQC